MLSPQRPLDLLGLTQSSDFIWTPRSHPEPWAAAEEPLGSQSYFLLTPSQQLQEPVTELNSLGNATSISLGPCDPHSIYTFEKLM